MDKTRIDYVGNEEFLNRSVRLEPINFRVSDNGKFRVSANAFADRSKRPSVYRRILTDDPPYSNPPRMSPNDAIITLQAGRIRGIDPIIQISGTGKTATERRYIIDIDPDTSHGQHRSHAVIFSTPNYQTARPFEKLKELLARLVDDWAIPPDETFLQQLSPR